MMAEHSLRFLRFLVVLSALATLFVIGLVLLSNLFGNVLVLLGRHDDIRWPDFRLLLLML
jgi:hypothetical protein